MATSTPSAVKFSSTQKEYGFMDLIWRRAEPLLRENGWDTKKIDFMMDLDATNSNGCKLDLLKLATFPDFDMMHDVCGIMNHIDRRTGKLKDCFLPRCAR